jgi:cysteine-S-conjugate beta-lyase
MAGEPLAGLRLARSPLYLRRYPLDLSMTQEKPSPAPSPAASAAGCTGSSPPSSRLKAADILAAGRGIDRRIDIVNVPVVRASTVLFDSVESAFAEGPPATVGERHRATYATSGTETTFALMDALAELEGKPHACRAALMPSGLSAISTALLAFTQPGDHLLMSDSVYGPARVFVNTLLARFGVRTTFFDPEIAAEGPGGLAELIQPETRIIYLESPGSYTFELQDVPAICALARSRGILTMLDNTYASPCLARPFDWGVDMTLLALTKYWAGHADVLMGAVVIREEHFARLWAAVKQTGLCVGGDDAWLVLRGMRTVGVRMRRHEETGLAVARWLQQRPEVRRVLHPGLPEHPRHDIFRRDFLGSCGLLSVELKPVSQSQVAALCNGRRHFSIGYSWGGFESLIMPASLGASRTVARWQGGPLVRIHCGLEDAQDLIDDLEGGLRAMQAAAG